MKNNILVAFLGLSLVVGLSGVVLAQTATTTAASTSITSQDLIGGDPGLLPTSPIYFLKNWGWAIQRFFTFNSVAKAQLDLHITNVKAAEIAKLQENVSNNAEAIAKALSNYQDSVSRLQNELQSLAQTSQNPNVKDLLQNLADRTVKHEALFNELKDKFSTSTDVQDLIQENNQHLDEILKEADNKDDEGDFGQTLSNALTDASSSIYSEHAVEILNHLQEVLPEKAQEIIQHVQEKIQERLQEASSSEIDNENNQGNSSSLDQEFENNLEDLNNCGPMPTSTGNWECDNNVWRLHESDQQNQQQLEPQNNLQEQQIQSGEGN